MPLGVIFGENRKKGKTRKIWTKRVPKLQRREPTPRRRPTPQRGVLPPRKGWGTKRAPPSGTLRRSVAMP